MNKTILVLLTGTMIGCVGCTKKEDKEPQRQGQAQMSASPRYDVKNVQTFRGQVVQTLYLFGPEGSEQVGIMLSTPQGTIPVILGPSSFVMGGDVQLSSATDVEVTGSVVYVEGQIIVVAQKVTTGGYTLSIRDKNGKPLWYGWKKE